MNAREERSSPFKGEGRRGMGLKNRTMGALFPLMSHPHPNPPLEGEGATFMRLP